MHNVLVDLHRLGGNKYNGLYHFCYHLGRHLALAQPAGLDLHFYVPEQEQQIFGDNVHYTIQKSRDKFYRFGTSRFNVWHIATTLSWYRPFNSRTKNIFTIHDLNFLTEPEYSPKSRKRYHRLIQDRVQRADHLTFISRFAQQQAQECLDLGKAPQTIIYNGCNKPAELPVAPAYQPQRPFLFSVGQAHARKNFHVLPALLVGNDYELIIAGLKDFPYRDTILEEAKKMGVEERVTMTGPVSEAEKYWYYQHCLAFVFPSIGEGFGLPVLEAMQFGKPCFLSTATSLPEVGGEQAFYFHNFDAADMRKVFEDGMHRYGQGGMEVALKAQAEKFNWSTAASSYIDVYRSLLPH